MKLLCSSPIGRGCARLGACSIRGPASPSAHGLATASSSEWADLYVRENESCQLSAVRLACPEGLEPPTYSLEGYCSIQLSYGQMDVVGRVADRLAECPQLLDAGR